jgi:Predicted membrane protein
MAEKNDHFPGFIAQFRKIGRTALGVLQNRGELLAVEWQEAKIRTTEIVFWAVAAAILAMSGLLLLTATIILLFPAELRIYAFAGFAVLYFIGAVVAFFNVKALLKHEPFAESISQVRKDSVWLESLQ